MLKGELFLEESALNTGYEYILIRENMLHRDISDYLVLSEGFDGVISKIKDWVSKMTKYLKETLRKVIDKVKSLIGSKTDSATDEKEKSELKKLEEKISALDESLKSLTRELSTLNSQVETLEKNKDDEAVKLQLKNINTKVKELREKINEKTTELNVTIQKVRKIKKANGEDTTENKRGFMVKALEKKGLKEFRVGISTLLNSNVANNSEISDYLNQGKKVFGSKLYDEINERSLKAIKTPKEEWNKEYLGGLRSILRDNFCKELISHIIKVKKFVRGA